MDLRGRDGESDREKEGRERERKWRGNWEMKKQKTHHSHQVGSMRFYWEEILLKWH